MEMETLKDIHVCMFVIVKMKNKKKTTAQNLRNIIKNSFSEHAQLQGLPVDSILEQMPDLQYLVVCRDVIANMFSRTATLVLHFHLQFLDAMAKIA